MNSTEKMDRFVSWAKRRGVIWPSSEIYGGLGSMYDYGTIGIEMKNKLKRRWWSDIVHKNENIIGIDSAIILNTDVWKASGHLEKFTDPLVEDKVTHKRYRADDLPKPGISPDGNPVTEAIPFNTMLKTFIGPKEETAAVAYLRPETCQGIFINFKQSMEVSRLKPPMGIAQIGKSFRNEITPGNFTFRTREFEQMELEYFVYPENADEAFEYWVQKRFDWYISLGINKENLRLKKHSKKDLAHYSKATTDVEYMFPWGWGELEGIANRGDYDLLQHQKATGKDMSVFDEETRERFHPYVIEPSGGVDRALLAILLDSWNYHEKGRSGEGEEEVILSVDRMLSAYDAAILPLVKKPPLIKLADKLASKLRAEGKYVYYDEAGSIGRRYRRQDEVGTPVCYTIDFQSVEDNTVTARDRDTMKQKRVNLDDIK